MKVLPPVVALRAALVAALLVTACTSAKTAATVTPFGTVNLHKPTSKPVVKELPPSPAASPGGESLPLASPTASTPASPAPTSPGGSLSAKSGSAPLIDVATGTPATVGPNQAMTFTTLAESPLGKPLTYTWSSTSGVLNKTTGQVVTWTPAAHPDGSLVAGPTTLTVVISDGTTSTTQTFKVNATSSGAVLVPPPPVASGSPTGTPTSTPTPAPGGSVNPQGVALQNPLTIKVLAGGKTGVDADGTGAAATLAYVTGLVGMAFEPSAGAPTALWFTEPGDYNRIRRVDLASGAVTRVPLKLNGLPDQNYPIANTASLVSDPVRKVFYLADSGKHVIDQVGLDGTVTVLVGQYGQSGQADGAAASFNAPSGLALSGDTLYVSDTNNHCIRTVNLAAAGGPVTATYAGAPVAGTAVASASATAARFNLPGGLALVGTTLYVADTGNASLRKVDLASNTVTLLAGQPGKPGAADGPAATATFSQPFAVTADGQGNLYVGDQGTTVHRVRRVSAQGNVTTVAGGADERTDTNGLSAAYGLLVATQSDGSLGVLYCYDRGPAGAAAGGPGGRLLALTP